MMMNNEDRKKIFWLLKKYSSYTAWKAFGDAFQTFTDAWEYAVTQAKPPLDSDDIWVEALKDFWKVCEAFDKGLSLLKHGDRYIFRYKNNWLIEDKLVYASRLIDPDEYEHEWMVNKNEIYAAHKILQKYKKVFLITENPDKTLAATFDTETVFWTDTWPRHLDYSQFNFPSMLGDVPDATDVIVNTGSEVPVDGIWEPEWLDPTQKNDVVNNLRSLFLPSISSNVQKGCMNYLTAGTVAQLYRIGQKEPIIPVRWRLIWQDDRYKDSSIPSEEVAYLAGADTLDSDRASFLPIYSIEAGRRCSQTGYWFTLAQANSRRYFKEEEIMPALSSDYGATIWQWDSDQ